mgnify:CR=1 FL=1
MMSATARSPVSAYPPAATANARQHGSMAAWRQAARGQGVTQSGVEWQAVAHRAVWIASIAFVTARRPRPSATSYHRHGTTPSALLVVPHSTSLSSGSRRTTTTGRNSCGTGRASAAATVAAAVGGASDAFSTSAAVPAAAPTPPPPGEVLLQPHAEHSGGDGSILCQHRAAADGGVTDPDCQPSYLPATRMHGHRPCLPWWRHHSSNSSNNSSNRDSNANWCVTPDDAATRRRGAATPLHTPDHAIAQKRNPKSKAGVMRRMSRTMDTPHPHLPRAHFLHTRATTE